MRKVFHVELLRSDGSHRHLFFGSKMAICQNIPPEELGIGYKYLCSLNLEQREYHGKKAIIRVGRLITTRSARDTETK